MYVEKSGIFLPPPSIFLKAKNTETAATNAGITIIKANVCHLSPTHSNPQKANPPSNTPVSMGAVLSPNEPPTRCTANAVAFRFGYADARVPNAGACQNEAPHPTIVTPIKSSQ